MKTFKQFVLSKNENNSNLAINESIVVPRILMQKIGDIARPIFQKIADDIDDKVSIGKYAEKFLASDFLSMIGIELGNPYFKKIEIEIKNLINEYVEETYLSGDIDEDDKEKILLRRFTIRSDQELRSNYYEFLSTAIQLSIEDFNANTRKGGKLIEIIQKIEEQYEDAFKEHAVPEIVDFGSFYEMSAGAAIGFSTKELKDMNFRLFIQFDFTFLLFYAYVVLSKTNYFQNKLEDMINNFVDIVFIPCLTHEITHYIQFIKSLIASRVINVSHKYANREAYSNKFWIEYLSDPKEIGAHANEFVQNLYGHFPKKSSIELLNMVKRGNIPYGASMALDKYLDFFSTDSKNKELGNNLVLNKFKKMVYNILIHNIELESNKEDIVNPRGY